MGFFNKPESTPALTPSQNDPLSRERIEAFLTSQGWAFGVDPDGDVGGRWDDNLFYFFRLGDAEEVLQIRGRWKHSPPVDREAEIVPLLNELNGTLIWPKLYARVEGEELGIYAEVSTDLEHGVSDDQLGQLLSCGLMTGLRAFELLGERWGLPQE